MKHTHKTRLLEYLEEFGSITTLQAIVDLGNTRLASRIHELRSEGYDITSQPMKVPTRWGTETTVTKYIYSPCLDSK
jgi:biotin operon repressor